MKRNYYPANFFTSNVYDGEKVKEKLNSFENVIIDNNLITKYRDRTICSIEVSNIYYNFDFSSFSKSLLEEIVKYFQPEKYSLKVSGGTQELKLIGGELFIDGDRYEKMISIVNSTDKSKALSMNIGLIKTNNVKRKILCTILTNFTNKHYKSTLPDKIKMFSDNLKHFNVNIDYHIKTIEDLKNYNVSIVDISKALMYNNKGELIKSNLLKIKALGKKLMYKTDNSHYKTLINLTPENIDKVEDFDFNSKVIHDCYMEIFKDNDTSLISRESRRIIEAIDKVKKSEVK